MAIIFTSKSIFNNNPDVKNALKEIANEGHFIFIVSNRKISEDLENTFREIKKIRCLSGLVNRQNGDIIEELIKQYNYDSSNIFVLSGCTEDIQMGKNGGAVLIGAGWSKDKYVSSLGIKAESPSDLLDIITKTNSWRGHWFYAGGGKTYKIKALGNLSSYNQSEAQIEFSQELKTLVKNGGPKLDILVAIVSRSLLKDGFNLLKDTLWGVYPSSNSQNDDTEILTDFTHRLRTTVSKVQLAKKGKPLFIRHTKSIKRSRSNCDRTNPKNQIETIHLNPFYKGKISNRNIIVIDDCTTYGLSFAVAAAFLRKAGAKSITGVAIGKFGNQLRYKRINIESDPFAPVTNFSKDTGEDLNDEWNGERDEDSQNNLRDLI